MIFRVVIGLLVCAGAGVLGWQMNQPAVVVTPPLVAKAPAPPPPKLATPPELQAALAQAVQLLRAHDVVGMIQFLMPPEDVQKLLQQLNVATPEEAVALMRQRMPTLDKQADETLQVLLAIQGHTPEMSLDGTQAIFKLESPIGNNQALTFVKIDGHWYLR